MEHTVGTRLEDNQVAAVGGAWFDKWKMEAVAAGTIVGVELVGSSVDLTVDGHLM